MGKLLGPGMVDLTRRMRKRFSGLEKTCTCAFLKLIGEKPMIYLICMMEAHYTSQGFNWVKEMSCLHSSRFASYKKIVQMNLTFCPLFLLAFLRFVPFDKKSMSLSLGDLK